MSSRLTQFVRCLPVVAALALLPASGQAVTQTIVYPDFTDLSQIQMNGAAATINASGPVNFGGQNVLRLTNAGGQSGTAFLTQSIPLTDEGDFKASFSTAFQFQVTAPGGIRDNDGQGADGICFVVQTVANNAGGTGGGIGYQGIPRSVGIEFDTWNNGAGYNDADGNHVGIDLNGEIKSVLTRNVPTRMNDGDFWNAWVDYNGSTQLLEVRLSMDAARPVDPYLAYTVDLPAILQQPNAFVGFTSGTGSAWGCHDIRSWTFTNTYRPIDNAVPEPSTLALLLGAAPAFLVRRRHAR